MLFLFLASFFLCVWSAFICPLFRLFVYISALQSGQLMATFRLPPWIKNARDWVTAAHWSSYEIGIYNNSIMLATRLPITISESAADKQFENKNSNFHISITCGNLNRLNDFWLEITFFSICVFDQLVGFGFFWFPNKFTANIVLFSMAPSSAIWYISSTLFALRWKSCETNCYNILLRVFIYFIYVHILYLHSENLL